MPNHSMETEDHSGPNYVVDPPTHSVCVCVCAPVRAFVSDCAPEMRCENAAVDG